MATSDQLAHLLNLAAKAESAEKEKEVVRRLLDHVSHPDA